MTAIDPSAFDADTRGIASLAEEQARSLGHLCVDSEHLLLAVLSRGGPAADDLAARGVTHDRVREQIAALVGTADALAPDAPLSWAPTALAILDAATRADALVPYLAGTPGFAADLILQLEAEVVAA
jgi:poly(3-hydroxybutyrate) depolymerase